MLLPLTGYVTLSQTILYFQSSSFSLINGDDDTMPDTMAEQSGSSKGMMGLHRHERRELTHKVRSRCVRLDSAGLGSRATS